MPSAVLRSTALLEELTLVSSNMMGVKLEVRPTRPPPLMRSNSKRLSMVASLETRESIIRLV